VVNGRRELGNGKSDAWAFAYEGFIVADGKRHGAVLIEAWTHGMPKPVVVAQLWERGTKGSGMTLIGAPLLLPEPTNPVALEPREEQAFKMGIARHKEALDKGLIGNPGPGPTAH